MPVVYFNHIKKWIDMHRAFTIVEVLISVVILALVGTALLKNAGMNLDFLKKISNKEEAIDMMTIIASHRNPDFNHLQKSLYDFLSKEYLLDDNDLQKLLRDTKIKYQEAPIKISLPILEGFDEEDQEEQPQNPIDIQFVKISAVSKSFGDYLYILELNE